jgi:hypothetical protein
MTLGYRFGVPPSGGGAHANTMTTKTFNAHDQAGGSPAEAGTPNLRAPYGVPPSGGGAEIQQGRKELEGMPKWAAIRGAESRMLP